MIAARDIITPLSLSLGWSVLLMNNVVVGTIFGGTNMPIAKKSCWWKERRSKVMA